MILDAKVMLASEDEKKKNKTISQTKKALEECFGITEEAVDKVIEENPDGRYNIMLKGATYAQAQAFEAMEENEDDKEEYAYISGVWLEEAYVRTYPYNNLQSMATQLCLQLMSHCKALWRNISKRSTMNIKVGKMRMHKAV